MNMGTIAPEMKQAREMAKRILANHVCAVDIETRKIISRQQPVLPKTPNRQTRQVRKARENEISYLENPDLPTLSRSIGNSLGLGLVHQNRFRAHFGEASLHNHSADDDVELEDLLRAIEYKLTSLINKGEINLLPIEQIALLSAVGREGKSPRTLLSLKDELHDELTTANLTIEQVMSNALTKFANASLHKK